MSQTAVSSSTVSGAVTIRLASPDDAQVCGEICFEAFANINAQHGFPPDIPSPEVGVHIIAWMFSHPGFYCLVAEFDGRVVGSNCLDERSIIAGIGPITVAPSAQNRRVGRKLMEGVLERVRERNFAGVRLVQAAFHNRSLSLYTALGFDAREPLSVVQGTPIRREMKGCRVRAAQASEIEKCDAVCKQVHGHDRHGELLEAIERGAALLVERDGQITGYATGLAFFSHAVAESNLDLQALIASAESFGGPGILVPTRNAPLLRWCLENGLQIKQPLTLMSMGLYNEPAGAYLPSISY